MAKSFKQTTQIQGCIDRLRDGDEDARKELLNSACERLTRLTRKMLRGFPRVKRWEETDDVVQNAAMRLYQSLAKVKPASAADFFRLAAVNIRRELLDLAKHYYGPRGHGANYASMGPERGSTSEARPGREPPDKVTGPERLAAWSEFHAQVEKLPDEERELFDLIWYQGLAQAEAGALLGISERTVKRRWASARLKLHEALKGDMPEV